MFHRRWKPSSPPMLTTSKSEITLYDFGAYYGEMTSDDVWSCWEICSRKMNDLGEIEEELKQMPQDWIPFDTFAVEVYTGAILQGQGCFQVRGWSVQTRELGQVAPSQLNRICPSVVQRALPRKHLSHPSQRTQISSKIPEQKQ